MIRILGPRRVFVLLTLIGINVMFGALIYYYLQPETSNLERQLRMTRGMVSTVQSDIDRILVEFEQLEAQQEFFKTLESDGFFETQNRREAELLFEKIQRQSDVVSAKASIRAAKALNDEDAIKAEHVVLSSPVEIELEAISDIDIYRYLDLIYERFPGYVSVDNIEMSRAQDVSNPVLRGIANGERVPLVRAKFNMSWQTLVPKAEVPDLLGHGGLR